MDCQTCKERKKQAEPIPYIAYESAMARSERTIRIQAYIIILLICVLAASVTLAVLANNKRIEAINERIDTLNELRELESSIETVYEYEVEQEADNDGRNYFAGGDFYGEANSQS